MNNYSSEEFRKYATKHLGISIPVASWKVLNDWKKNRFAKNAIPLFSLNGILVPEIPKYVKKINFVNSKNKKTNKIEKCKGHNL